MYIKTILATIIIILSFSGISHSSCDWTGNIGATSSLTDANINECLSEASALSGEVTINLSAGTLATTATYTINMLSGFANVTSLRVFGAGTVPTGSTKGSAGSTVLARGTSNNYAFNITGSSAKKFRLSNITFTGGATSNAMVRVSGTSKPSTGGGFRLDHLSMPSIAYGQRAFWIDGATYGVIDHNLITSGYQLALVKDAGPGGNPSWHKAIDFGADNVYFEDNEVTGTAATKRWMFCDGVKGARIVVRYNTITNFYIGQHDAASGADGRGTFSYVAYNNTLIQTLVSSADPPFFLRGGTNIIYNNTSTITGGSIWSSAITMQNARSMIAADGTSVGAGVWDDICDTTHRKVCLGTTYWADAYCTTDANCGGESGACQNMDLAEDSTGYPCRDQIGMSYTTADGYTHYPSLFWNNTHQGTYATPYVRDYNYVTDHIKNNRDYCHHATTMPATCGGHATTYTPYTYPHPLTGGGGGEGDTTAPSSFSAFVTTEQACTSNPRDVSIGISTNEPATCKWDTSVDGSPTYAELSNTFTGTGTTTHTGTVSAACGATTTIYYACQDAIPNTTAVSSWTFTVAPEEDTTTPVITSVTSAKQAVALTQKLSITTQVGASCRYCVDGVGGCTSATAWADRTAFSVTGGSTTHHEVAITQAASSSATYNVICQNTQGTATSANSEITITTDAAKAITAGSGSLSITQGSGSLSVTILP